MYLVFYLYYYQKKYLYYPKIISIMCFYINILKKKGLKVFERHIEMAELEVFEQCWLTGTAAEVTPVGKIGDYNFEVGDFVKDLVLDYEKIVRE